jgi:polysaccharide biosynthesis protein PslH
MKRVLFVIPFKRIYPPMNGGTVRCINLLNQLCKYFEVTAIMHQDKASMAEAFEEFPHLKKCNIISTGSQQVNDLFSIFPLKLRKALRYRYWNRSLKGPGNDDFLAIYPLINKLVKSKQFDFVIMEDMSILNLAESVYRHQPLSSVIYDAYNVNTRLAEAALQSNTLSRKEFEMVKEAEAQVYKQVDSVFTCSELDLDQLIAMNEGKLNGVVVPNGVGIPPADKRLNFNDRKNKILFCGSLDYLPNREGLYWFCTEVLPLVVEKNPSAQLLVVGKGDPGAELKQALDHPSIKFYGMVDKVSDYYNMAAVAIVPLLSGSGTRLKLLEAMGYRTPVISTTSGAEGIAHTHGKNIIIADNKEEFSDSVAQLIKDPALCANIADEAFSFVKGKYDWNVIGEKLSAYLQGVRKVNSLNNGTTVG